MHTIVISDNRDDSRAPADHMYLVGSRILVWPLFTVLSESIPTNKSHWPNVWTMLGQRRRRWTNIVHTLGQWLVFAGMWYSTVYSLLVSRISHILHLFIHRHYLLLEYTFTVRLMVLLLNVLPVFSAGSIHPWVLSGKRYLMHITYETGSASAFHECSAATRCNQLHCSQTN